MLRQLDEKERTAKNSVQSCRQKNSLQQIINVASDFNLLQKVSFGTRKSKLGNSNILELIFTNNHELITNIYGEHSEISDYDYIYG